MIPACYRLEVEDVDIFLEGAFFSSISIVLLWDMKG